MTWTQRDFVCDNGPFDLIPYTRDDGSAQVGGYLLSVQRRPHCRISGALESARAAAEGILHERFQHLIREAHREITAD